MVFFNKFGRRVRRRLSILIVPEGGSPRRYQISLMWLQIAAAAGGLFLLLVIMATISYARLFGKALERDRLLAENHRLEQENRRVVALAQEVEQSRKSLERIVRALGGKLDLESGDIPVAAPLKEPAEASP